MNIINENNENCKRYLPHELKTRLNAVLTYRNDNERFYNNLKFDSLEDLRQKGKKHLKRSNQIPMAILGYKIPLEKRHELLFSLPNNYNTFISLVNAI